jgi:hypothetical protein
VPDRDAKIAVDIGVKPSYRKTKYADRQFWLPTRPLEPAAAALSHIILESFDSFGVFKRPNSVVSYPDILRRNPHARNITSS